MGKRAPSKMRFDQKESFEFLKRDSILQLRQVRSTFTVVSSYQIVGSRQALVLDAPFGGGFVLSLRWFALGVLSCVLFFRRFALGVGFGRYPEGW